MEILYNMAFPEQINPYILLFYYAGTIVLGLRIGIYIAKKQEERERNE